MSYTVYFESVASEIDQLIKTFSYKKKYIGYGYRRTFANGHRVDLIDYKKTWSVIFRVRTRGLASEILSYAWGDVWWGFVSHS